MKAKPKNVRYIFTYNFIKESAMLECEYELRSRYHADLIKSPGIFYVSIYRETHGANLTEIVTFRQTYLKHVFSQKNADRTYFVRSSDDSNGILLVDLYANAVSFCGFITIFVVYTVYNMVCNWTVAI